MARLTRRRTDTGDQTTVQVDWHEDLVLLRTPTDDTFTEADIEDLTRELRSAEGVVTILAGSQAVVSEAFWPQATALLDTLREMGTTKVRLVMTGAGTAAGAHPALAARIADAWGMTVEAPDGAPLVVPGGSLFVPVSAGQPGGWWRFRADTAPVPLGPRCPAPPWQSMLDRVPAHTAGGYAVAQIPAGLIVRSPRAPAPRPGDLYHAVPLDPQRPTVVVGVPGSGRIPGSELAELFTDRRELAWHGVRLAPGGPWDLLPLGQQVADALGAEVEVSTGLPLLSTDQGQGSFPARSVLIAADGAPGWMPFVDSVACDPSQGGSPAAKARLLGWTLPVPGAGDGDGDGATAPLGDGWQVTATRAGLWVGPMNGDDDAVDTEHAVDPEGPVIEVGVPGVPLPDSLWPALDRLLAALTAGTCKRATVSPHGPAADGGAALRALAARHGLRGVGHVTPGSGPVPAPVPVPAAAPAPAPGRAPASGRAPATGPAPTPGPVPATGPRTTKASWPSGPQAAWPTIELPTASAAPDHSPVLPPPPAAATGGGLQPRPPVPEPALPQPRTAPPEALEPWYTGDPAYAPQRRPQPPAAPSPEESAPPSTPARVHREPVAGPFAGSDLDAAWERLRQGRRSVKRNAALPPATAPSPDFDRAWAALSQGREKQPAVTGEPTKRPETGAPPQPERVRVPQRPETLEEPRPEPARAPMATPEQPPAPARPAPAKPAPAKPEPARPVTPEPAPPSASPSTSPSTAVTAAVGSAPAPVPRSASARALSPGHVSGDADRDALRALAGPAWEQHVLAADEVLTRMPNLTDAEREVAEVDLIALWLYLDDERPLGPRAFARGLRAGDDHFHAYRARLASGLRRMPAHRGVVLRGAGGAPDDEENLPVGSLLRDELPVSAVPASPTEVLPRGPRYVIWSVTGRLIQKEVVFASGTPFRVLDVRRGGSSPVILLRELPVSAAAPAAPTRSQAPTELDSADLAALARLDGPAKARPGPAKTAGWPQRCAGPIGNGP